MTTKTYKQRVREIYNGFRPPFDGKWTSEKDLVIMTEALKKDYPGNYVLKETFIPTRLQWGLKIEFETPEDETWFRLKYD